jgi:sugar phosphate isomerase/epimerase
VTRRELILAAAGGVTLGAEPGRTLRAGIVPAGAGRRGREAVATFWSNCDQAAALGFHFIEINNTRAEIVEAYSARVPEFRDEMAKRRLTMAGVALFSHIADESRRQELMDHHLALGRFLAATGGSYITHMIAPGTLLNEASDDAEYSRVDTKVWAAHADEIGKRLLNEHGVSLAYHPEQGEVRSGLCDLILDNTDGRYMRLLVDTGHIASGGQDALAMCKRYSSRLACVHLKDFQPAAQPVKAGNVPFGEGVVDLGAIANYLRATQFDGWVMAESGGTNEHMRDYMVRALNLAL